MWTVKVFVNEDKLSVERRESASRCGKTTYISANEEMFSGVPSKEFWNITVENINNIENYIQKYQPKSIFLQKGYLI